MAANTMSSLSTGQLGNYVKEIHTAEAKADILVVDDQIDNIRFLEMALGRFGYNVRSATSGQEALEISQSHPPELIMLDINMPDMDGYETCRQLKANRSTYHIPVIFISALESVKDKLKAFKSGGVDYVTKPFQFEEVLARIETHINIRRLQSALEDSNRELADRLDELEQIRQAEREQSELAEAYRDTIAAINSTLNFNEVLDLILLHLERVVPHKAANITLVEDSNTLHFARARGYEQLGVDKTLLGMRLNSEALPIWRRMLTDPSPLLVTDTHKDDEWVTLKGFDWVRSYASAPIIVQGEVIGLLNLESDVPNFFTQVHTRRLQTFADQAAVAIEKARLFDETERLAITDGLTGIYNRRHTLELGQLEYDRAIRYNHPFSAIMVDVDHFKSVNDDHGHPTGDKVLQDLAQLLRDNLRINDVLGRYGGEEFLIFMPNTDLSNAMEVAERIRHQTNSTYLGDGDKRIQITVSMGVATCCKPKETLDDLIYNADEALYAAKAVGRNCVRGFTD